MQTQLKSMLGCSCAIMLISAAATYQNFLAPAYAQSVIKDGTTSTTVSQDPSGAFTVDIAGAHDDVSHNKYTEFSVPSAGVTLNNTNVNANLIINEVTSARHSLIEGPLRLLGGPR